MKYKWSIRHRQGRGWVVVYYWPGQRAGIESHEMPYGMVASARQEHERAVNDGSSGAPYPDQDTTK